MCQLPRNPFLDSFRVADHASRIRRSQSRSASSCLAQLRPGERVSGSVVEDPQKYDGVQDLRVIRMELPLESQGEAATLGGWALEAPGEGRCQAVTEPP